MEFCIYNSFGIIPPRTAHSSKKYIWLYNSSESNNIINYIIRTNKNKGHSFMIEDVFEFVAANDLSEEKINRFTVAEKKESQRKVRAVLYAQSDTLANSMLMVSKALSSGEYAFFTPNHSDEGAADFFRKKSIPFTVYSYSALKMFKPNVFLLLNDWSKEPQRIMAHCRWLGIPTICLQESIIDFGDHFKRMQHADYVFVQGVQTINDLNRSHYFITGNPRYEAIRITGSGGTNRAFINCNFTYKIFENVRESWLRSIIETLEELNMDYFISQHPRDTANLSKYKNVERSSSEKVHAQISESRIVITRFSSLIHEALVLEKPVIYYNPHGEKMKYDFSFNHKFLFLAESRTDLKKTIQLAIENEGKYNNERKEYLANHCLPSSKSPSEIIACLLQNDKLVPKKFSFNDFVAILFYYPSIKKILYYLRNLFR